MVLLSSFQLDGTESVWLDADVPVRNRVVNQHHGCSSHP